MSAKTAENPAPDPVSLKQDARPEAENQPPRRPLWIDAALAALLIRRYGN